MSMDIKEILDCLPHRFPFLLVDRVLSCEPGKKIVAIKNVAMNEPYFQGHFPGNPVMPGVMILEALAQAAAILSFKTVNYSSTAGLLYYFVGIDNARFKKPVIPGDQLILDVSMLRSVRGIAKLTAQARVGETVVTEAELMCTIKKQNDEPSRAGQQ
jgi:3-hydroxyacyl-[acyl-carrier-protein] dehydratase